ncbi:Iron-sulfur cluster assembly accessory protein [Blastococcus sp. DSM 46786]|nr:Iron-sulfur cluster assembly accessory protein [Blastococcus sp. DSM 46786]
MDAREEEPFRRRWSVTERVRADTSEGEDRNMTVQDTAATGVVLSDPAAAKVKALLDQEGRDDLRLRIAVQPGGCSGLRYQLFFDERFLDGDQTYDFGGVEVIVDRMSGPYLGGAVIDFVDSIEKQGFTIDNPNAQGSCACGDSFN